MSLLAPFSTTPYRLDTSGVTQARGVQQQASDRKPRRDSPVPGGYLELRLAAVEGRVEADIERGWPGR